MKVYWNLPLICLLQTKSLVLAQDMYHSYHTYDFYSQSEENDFSHSTTQEPFECYDFLAEAKNTTELVEKLRTNLENYFHLSFLIENVDRAHYTMENPYHMKPSPIGFNAHLESPEVVVKTGVLLMDHFQYPNTSKTEFPLSRPNLKVLDIGAGTGYTSTIFTHLSGLSGQVIALEHVPELVKLAHMALDYDDWYLLESGRLKFIVKDGSKGHKEEGPYDIIHIGAACLDVPHEILDQLKPGGRLVYHKGAHLGHLQYLATIDRCLNGTFLPEEIQYEKEITLEGLIPFKEQMDEFKLRLQGKYQKRYRIDNPEVDFRHALGDERYGVTHNVLDISPRYPINYTGITFDLKQNVERKHLFAEGLERSDMIID